MRNFLRVGVLSALLVTCGSIANAQVSFGIRIGPPPPPARAVYARPVRPGPDYVWVNGYWYPERGHYLWHSGYWTRAPYQGARWIAPHYQGGQFYEGYWQGNRGRVEHDHRWDWDNDHDYNRYQNRGNYDNRDDNRNNNGGDHDRDNH